MTIDDRRFIEESFPVKEVGAISGKEKSIRKGNISTLHIWWARRPLAASRATAYAALTPYPPTEEEREKKKQFIIDLCKWENYDNQVLLKRARQEILEANCGVPPKVLDPFSGGGSYPLEVLRLGCNAYANDYNPVAVLIEKATIEYPQKFGQPFEGIPEWANGEGLGAERIGKSGIGGRKTLDKQLDLLSSSSVESQEPTILNPLLNAVRFWGEWVLDEARKELDPFYPPDPDGNVPVGYIWARTIFCQNPTCGQEIPLLRQFWLAKKNKKNIALYPEIIKGNLEFRLVGDGFSEIPINFNPEKGTVKRAVVVCPCCGNMIDAKTTRRLFQEGRSGQRMMVVILAAKHGRGKTYRLANENDMRLFQLAEETLSEKRENLKKDWGIDPIPDEILPIMSGVFNVPLYGMNTWGSLFNSRQKLTLIIFVSKIRHAYDTMIANVEETEFSKAVITYIGLALSRFTNRMSTLSYWFIQGEKIQPTFVRQALGMVWDYVEMYPFNESSGGWRVNMYDSLNVIENLSTIKGPFGYVSHNSATDLSFPDNYFDAIFTDPPYYNSVPYADLSDYFYVWLKRAIGNVYPDLFSTPLAPKKKEITEMAGWDPQRYAYKDKAFFEDNLKLAFLESFRILKTGGIAVIVYAHKSTEGWETVINALLDSALVVTGAWPLNTELRTRLRAGDSAALASSIYIVARKMPRLPTGFYNEVRTELRTHLDSKLHRLWEEGIGGADFFIAAIGSAIEVFGKYEQVMDFEGNIVRADRLLEEVRTIATDYAVRQILHNGFVIEISNITRLYVLWRWNYGEAQVPFDEARKMGQSCGIDISEMWSKTSVIRKQKQFVRMIGPQGRKLEDLDDPCDLIDVLHKALLLWENGQRAEMILTLTEKGHGKSEAFYRVAQAISETLPMESKEKKLLDGFLAGRERVQDEVEEALSQGRLL
ncbi:DUF1156 domain-containing protein [Chloroflexota bacterium]